jgi:hypothetical protein
MIPLELSLEKQSSMDKRNKKARNKKAGRIVATGKPGES